MTEQELEEKYPAIKWREPVTVHVPGGAGIITRLCCRYCIAQKGLKGQDVHRRGFESKTQFRRHMLMKHGTQ